MIPWKSTSDVISNPNAWFQSSAKKTRRKMIKITINNGDSDTTPLCWEKKTHFDWMTRSNNEGKNIRII